MGAVAAYDLASVYRSPRGSSPAPVQGEHGQTLLIKAASAVTAAWRAHWTAPGSTAVHTATADLDERVFLRSEAPRWATDTEMETPAARATDERSEIPGFLKAFEHVTGLNRTEMSELLGVSRPAYYGYLEGALPRERQLKRIDALKRLAEAMRAGYFTTPPDKTSVLAWLDAYIMQADRAALDALLKKGRTTFAVDPHSPERLVRTNPDGSTEVGRFVDGRFVPDTAAG